MNAETGSITRLASDTGTEEGVEMRKVNMETAVRKYNSLMYMLGYEHKSIGMGLSENTSDNPDNVKNCLYTLRDMVAEADYHLGTYYEDGHCNEELRRSDDPNERKMWASDVGKLKRFINRYEPFLTDDMECVQRHCSKYDDCSIYFN